MHGGLHFEVDESSHNFCWVCLKDFHRKPIIRLAKEGPRLIVCVCVTCLETMAGVIRKIQYLEKLRRTPAEDLLDEVG
jgi:hypothetical protein